MVASSRKLLVNVLALSSLPLSFGSLLLSFDRHAHERLDNRLKMRRKGDLVVNEEEAMVKKEHEANYAWETARSQTLDT